MPTSADDMTNPSTSQGTEENLLERGKSTSKHQIYFGKSTFELYNELQIIPSKANI